MILRVFTGRFVQTAERMSLVAIGLAVMVLANALLVVALVNKAHTVVMVPPALADTAEITQGRANDATLSAWGLSVANLVGNATPSNMPLILETLRSLMTPSAYQTISDQLTRQARDLQNDQLTLSFAARDLRVDSDTGRVFVTGTLTTHGLRNQRTQEERTYEMRFSVTNYIVRLAALTSYEGRPRSSREPS